MRHPTTWYVITDGGQARVLRKRDDHEGFETEREFVSEHLHSRTHDLGAERPGRSHESADTAHHAVEPREDLHRADKQDFVGEVARMLNEAHAQQEFDRLILVAPAHALAWLDDALDAGTKRTVAGKLQKDLTKVPNSDLGEHLAHLGKAGPG